MFNEFKILRRTLKTVLIIFLRTCKTVSRKSCIKIEDKNKISEFSYTVIVVEITMKFLVFIIPPSIYHG